MAGPHRRGLTNISRSGIRPLLDALRRHVERQSRDAGEPTCRRCGVLTTTYTGSTVRRALDEARRPGRRRAGLLRQDTTRLHAKPWLFRRRSGHSTACFALRCGHRPHHRTQRHRHPHGPTHRAARSTLTTAELSCGGSSATTPVVCETAHRLKGTEWKAVIVASPEPTTTRWLPEILDVSVSWPRTWLTIVAPPDTADLLELDR